MRTVPRTRLSPRVTFLLLVLALWMAGVNAGRAQELYSGEVPVADQGGAERQRALPLALEQVLQKLSGLRYLDDYPLVGPALEGAPGILLSYYYRNLEYPLADGSQARELRLVARFSPPDVDAMARSLQLPLWQPDRPPLILWLIIDSGFDRRIMPVEYAYLRQALDDVAERRGVPLRWPEPGPEGEYDVDPQLLWGGYTEDLPTAGRESVMIAAARREGLEWNVRINLGHEGRNQAWRLGDIDLQAALTEGLQQAVDQVAMLDTIAASDIGNWSQELVVSGLRSPDDYRRCLNYLQAISVVDSVAVISGQPGSVTFRLALNALPAYLDRSLAGDGVLGRSGAHGPWELLRVEPDRSREPQGVESDRSGAMLQAEPDDG